MKGDKDLLEVSINGGPLHRWQSCSMSNCHTGLAIQGGIRAANDPLYCA